MASFLRNHGAKRPMPLFGRGRARSRPTKLDGVSGGEYSHKQWRRHHDGPAHAARPPAPRAGDPGREETSGTRLVPEAPRMHVHALAWIVLAGIILTMIAVDIVGHVRTPHEPTLKEATWWSVAYIAIALLFGGIVWAVWGPQYGQEYLGGYITEKALSIDNLFVFVIILSSFRVPRKDQQEVLLAGIVIALILRLIFILAGAALIENFSWVFYIFGAWLLWTAINQVREGVGEDEEEEEYRPPSIVRWVSKIVPVTDGFVARPRPPPPPGRPHLRHSDAPVRHRGGHSRRHVRRRLDPRDLLAHQRGVPGVRRQRVLLARLASALLPHRWSA